MYENEFSQMLVENKKYHSTVEVHQQNETVQAKKKNYKKKPKNNRELLHWWSYNELKEMNIGKIEGQKMITIMNK